MFPKRELDKMMAWLDRYPPGATPWKRLTDLRKEFPAIRSQIEANGIITLWKLGPPKLPQRSRESKVAGPGSTWSPAVKKH
ncbi:MAG TPA: hypothetical protein VG456_10815 [Candidatus Sulfopaludibacter sp.]|jgi:hypothetical protein|nr:hypothetical protein [Candidatus Sulfopaludibacter sp.]